jgi:hypothetical protein
MVITVEPSHLENLRTATYRSSLGAERHSERRDSTKLLKPRSQGSKRFLSVAPGVTFRAPGLDPAESQWDSHGMGYDQPLSHPLSEFARTMLTGFSIHGISFTS